MRIAALVRGVIAVFGIRLSAGRKGMKGRIAGDVTVETGIVTGITVTGISAGPPIALEEGILVGGLQSITGKSRIHNTEGDLGVTGIKAVGITDAIPVGQMRTAGVVMADAAAEFLNLAAIGDPGGSGYYFAGISFILHLEQEPGVYCIIFCS